MATQQQEPPRLPPGIIGIETKRSAPPPPNVTYQPNIPEQQAPPNAIPQQVTQLPPPQNTRPGAAPQQPYYGYSTQLPPGAPQGPPPGAVAPGPYAEQYGYAPGPPPMVQQQMQQQMQYAEEAALQDRAAQLEELRQQRAARIALEQEAAMLAQKEAAMLAQKEAEHFVQPEPLLSPPALIAACVAALAAVLLPLLLDSVAPAMGGVQRASIVAGVTAVATYLVATFAPRSFAGH